MIYVLHTKPQAELDTVRELSRRGITAYAPMEIALLRKGGRWNEIPRLIFSGYVFATIAELTAEIYYTVKSCPGVIRFLGASAPFPLAKWEEEYIQPLLDGENGYSRGFIQNGALPISSGILQRYQDKIISFSRRQKRAVVELMIGGQPQRITFSCDIIQ